MEEGRKRREERKGGWKGRQRKGRERKGGGIVRDKGREEEKGGKENKTDLCGINIDCWVCSFRNVLFLELQTLFNVCSNVPWH